MCGRYNADDTMVGEIEKVVHGIEQEIWTGRSGDIFPSCQAMVIFKSDSGITVGEMNWGFLQYRKPGLFINARAETAMERKMFRESVLHRRCIIPAKHFYEWDADKNKVTFFREDQPLLYMAGFYQCFAGENRFIILTTQANESVSPVHHRMPLILEESELEEWVYDDSFTEFALRKTPPALKRRQEYEQLRLFF